MVRYLEALIEKNNYLVQFEYIQKIDMISH